jgi:hypothetical protein
MLVGGIVCRKGSGTNGSLSDRDAILPVGCDCGDCMAWTTKEDREMKNAKEYWQSQEPSLMTPEALGYIDTPAYLIKLSRGTGFNNEPIFGVSVANVDETRNDKTNNLSKMFNREADASAYITRLEWGDGY